MAWLVQDSKSPITNAEAQRTQRRRGLHPKTKNSLDLPAREPQNDATAAPGGARIRVRIGLQECGEEDPHIQVESLRCEERAEARWSAEGVMR
jgi:hypothetical protein